MRETAVHIDNLLVCYGQVPAIEGVSLDVADGEYLGIIGPNGGGKSTLLKAILGLIPATHGTVQVYGNSPEKNRSLVGYVPQFAVLDKQFPISMLEVVLTGRLKQGLSPFFNYTKEDKKVVYGLLAELNKDMTIILVTHDMLAISSQIHRLACLNGYLVYHGEPELTEKVVNNLYGCPVDLIAHGLPHRVLKDHEGGKPN